MQFTNKCKLGFIEKFTEEEKEEHIRKFRMTYKDKLLLDEIKKYKKLNIE